MNECAELEKRRLVMCWGSFALGVVTGIAALVGLLYFVSKTKMIG